MPAYLRPTTTDAALAALQSAPLVVVAGGTDHYPARVGRALTEDILDLTAIPELAGVRRVDRHWRIGATTTWAALRDAPLPPMFDALRTAAREVGGRQVQNAATIGGNLCNASPAADGVPPLLALDARVELTSARGRRTLPLAQFVSGPRRTLRAADELLTAVVVPEPVAPWSASAFGKLGSRRFLVISFVMVAVALEADARGTVVRAGVAVGACSPVARRIPRLEETLVGRTAGAALADCVEPAQFAALAPIDDVRADASYRLEAAGVLARRALAEAGTKLLKEAAP